MACESKKISELPGVTRVYPNDLIPIVQDGTNKYITAKDLLGCHDHSGDDCCCSQALSKAITALDFSRTAMDLANKAYDKACLVGTKLAALEEKVAEHDTLICNIRSLITLIFNKFEELEGNLKVTIQLSIDEQNKKYKVLQGTREVETILVPRPTTDFENGDGRPADAAEVLRRLRGLKGEVSKNLNFVAGKFTLNGENYNGTVEKTVNIPTRTSHLINDGDPDGNPFLTGVKGYDGRTAPVTDGIADLSRIPIKLDDLNDVDATNPQAGDILYHDGTKWVNTPLQDLVESIIDCEYIQNCVSNFKVTPKTHNKTAIETTAEYTVEATGAWTVAKESGDFITNFTPSGNGNGTITVTFGNNTTSSTRTAQFLVTETATGRLARVTINQAGVTPVGTHNVTYVVDGDATKITNLPSSPVTITNGLSYTFTPTIESGYEIPNNGVTFNPNGNGNYDGTTITIPQGITTDTTITIKVVAEGLAVLTVTPTSLEIEPEGTTDPEEITVSTTCTTPGITINTENLPTGINATLNSAQTLIDVEVDSSVAAGDYTFTVSDNCGNTETVTITKKEETPAYFDEDTNSFAFFSPKGVPVDGNDTPPSVAPDPNDPSTCWEHWNHSRDGLRDNYTYDNGVVTYIDSSDNSWNITVPYSDGILYLSIYWLSEYITDGNDVTNPTVVNLIQEGGTPTSVTASLSEDSNNGTITLKLLLTGTTYPTDLTTSNVHPININDFGSSDKTLASYAINSGLRVKISDSAPNLNGYPVIEGHDGYHYLIDTRIKLDNYLYLSPDSMTNNVSTEGSTDVGFELPRTLPEDEFNFVLDTQNTSSWISNVRFNNDRTSYGPVMGAFDTAAGSAETGTLAFSLNWTNPSPGHEDYSLTVNRQ